jgi:hypothetical protein
VRKYLIFEKKILPLLQNCAGLYACMAWVVESQLVNLDERWFVDVRKLIAC